MKRLIMVLMSGVIGWTLQAQPTVSVVSTEKSGDVTVVNLSFAGIESPTKLVVAYGLGAGQADGLGGWDAFEELATLTAGTTSYRYELPAVWGKTAFMARFFLAADVPYDNAIDYVETIDSTPLRLGFTAGPNMVSHLKFRYTKDGGGIFYGYMPKIDDWGSRDDATDYRMFFVGGQLYLDFPVNGVRLNNMSGVSLDVDYDWELGNFYVKDALTGETLSWPQNRQDFSRPEPLVRDVNEMTFFGMPGDNDRGRIYMLDVRDKDDDSDDLKLVHSFRPVLKDGVAGLYDSVAGVFVTPDEGGAALVYGKIVPYDGPMTSASELVSALPATDAPIIATVTYLETAPGSLTFRFGIASFGKDSETCDLYAEVAGGAGAGTRKIATATEPWLTATVEGLVPGETYAIRFFARNATWTEPAYYNDGEAMSFTMPGIRVTDGVDDYVLLDYIEATGAQSLDLGLTVTEQTETDMTLRIDTMLGEGALLGVAWDTAGYFLQLAGNFLRFHSGGAVVDVYENSGWSCGEWLTLHLSHTTFAVNENSYSLSPTGVDNPYNNLYLFATPNGCYGYGKAKLRHLKISEGSTVVRNYYAAKNLRTQEAGLFDIKNKTFTTSIEGTSPLIASEGLLDRKDYEKKLGLMVIIR